MPIVASLCIFLLLLSRGSATVADLPTSRTTSIYIYLVEFSELALKITAFYSHFLYLHNEGLQDVELYLSEQADGFLIDLDDLFSILDKDEFDLGNEMLFYSVDDGCGARLAGK